MTRRLGHEPFGWRPTTLLVSIRRYRCTGCGHVWRQDTPKAAEPRAKLSRRGLRWALEGIVCQHLTVAWISEGLGVTWNTANKAVLAEGKRVLIDDPHRVAGVKVIGVDEHVWRHTRRGDKYVTVIIDLIPIRDGTSPSRLLDMVESRSKQVFATGLRERPQHWRNRVEVVAMDGFSGFSNRRAGTADAPETRCIRPAGPCISGQACSPRNNEHAWKPCSPTIRISRSKPAGAPTSAFTAYREFLFGIVMIVRPADRHPGR
ncbi:transposase [Arthrobacter sp. UYEF21]